MSPSVKRTVKRSTRITAKAGRSMAQSAGKRLYFNRELSWLAFNLRVLEQARSEANPLLERVKFLAILSSNLDEFFEIRVAGLMQQQDSQGGEPSLDGLSPHEQLKQIRTGVNFLIQEQYKCWHDLLVPALAREKIVFLTQDQLDARQRTWVEEYFTTKVQPVLTPLAIDQAHPFPLLSNKILNILIALDNPELPGQEVNLAILPVPRSLPRMVQIEGESDGAQRFIFLSDILKLCAGPLFRGYVIRSAHAFRVTRNSDLYIDDEEAENLLKKIEDELRNLRRGAAVRLEIDADVDETLFQTLCAYLEQPAENVFRIEGPLNLLRLMSLYERTDRPDLKYPPFAPVEPAILGSKPLLFDVIRERDILLHHPYESFTPVVR
ncbi:MAG: RNA degradosome polyphosphate kinase, partial [Opitutales bacterium]